MHSVWDISQLICNANVNTLTLIWASTIWTSQPFFGRMLPSLMYLQRKSSFSKAQWIASRRGIKQRWILLIIRTDICTFKLSSGRHPSWPMNKNLQHEIQDRRAGPRTRAHVSQRDLSLCRSATGSLCTFFWPERMERWEGCEEGSHYKKKKKRSDTAGNKIWLAQIEGRWVGGSASSCKWNFNWKRDAKSRGWQGEGNHQWQSLSDFPTLCFFIFNLWVLTTQNFALRSISTHPGPRCLQPPREALWKWRVHTCQFLRTFPDSATFEHK